MRNFTLVALCLLLLILLMGADGKRYLSNTSGGNVFVIPFEIDNAVDEQIQMFRMPSSGTVANFGCTCVGSTTCANIAAELEECDPNGISCVSMNGAGGVEMDANLARVNDITFGGAAGADFAAGNQLRLRVDFLTSPVATQQLFCDASGMW